MTTTTTTFPTISLRNENGTWTEQGYVFTEWQFSPEDGEDTETLTDWLREMVADNGEGEWVARLGGIESEVITTGPTPDDVWQAAIEARDRRPLEIASVEWMADDCGVRNLVAATFADGRVMVCGAEAEGGYSYTVYSGPVADDNAVTTDGDDTIATLAEAIMAAAAQ